MTTLKDIAKISGVSLTQVSRALNDFDDVSEATKIKVKKVADELGYIKNINASRLARQTSNQISVIVEGFSQIRKNEDNILLSILNGIYNFAESIDYEVVPFLASEKHKKSYIEYCKSRLINGIIFIGGRYDNIYFMELIRSDFPCVVIDMPVIGKNKACVLIDNELYSQQAVNELIVRGYKKIGMINGHEFANVSIGRLQGYKNALMQNGIEFDESLVKNGEFSYSVALDRAEELISQNVDAIFSASDLMAMAVFHKASERGLNIPKDVALFGFDGLMCTNFTHPRLSTIVQDNFKKGYEASKLIHKILKNQEYMNKVYVDCEVKIRESI